MIKKWNAVCSWMLTLFLLGHMLTMSIPMLRGGEGDTITLTLRMHKPRRNEMMCQ